MLEPFPFLILTSFIVYTAVAGTLKATLVHSYVGILLQRRKPDDDATSLIHITQSVDLMLRDSAIQSINASSLVSVLWFDGLNTVTIDGLVSSEVVGCKRVITIQNTASQDDADCVRVVRGQFFDISAGALNFTNNSAAVYASGFKNITHSPSTISFDTDDGSPVTISNCSFADLTVRDLGYFDGAALHLSSLNITITNSTFSNCTARKGGAVYTYTNETLSPNWPNHTVSYVTVSGCHFDASSAGFGGGGFYLSGDDIQTSIIAYFSDTVFSGNVAIFGGGLAGSAVAEVDTTSCLFKKNTASQGLGAGLSSEKCLSNQLHLYSQCHSSDQWV